MIFFYSSVFNKTTIFFLLLKMFDEGENVVQIKLPDKGPKQTEHNSTNRHADMPISEFLRSDGDLDYDYSTSAESHDNSSAEDTSRDYSIQTWNNNAGLNIWGYDEKNQNSKKYGRVHFRNIVDKTFNFYFFFNSEIQCAIDFKEHSMDLCFQKIYPKPIPIVFIAKHFVERCRYYSITKASYMDWMRTISSCRRIHLTAILMIQIRRVSV